MRIGQLFVQEHEGISVIAGIYRTCFAAWSLEGDFPRFYLQNLSASPVDILNVEPEYRPIFLRIGKRSAFGRPVFYRQDDLINCGMLIMREGDNLLLLHDASDPYLRSVPVDQCRWMLWIKNKNFIGQSESNEVAA